MSGTQWPDKPCAVRAGYWSLLRFAWPYRRTWAGVLGLTILGIGTALLQPWPMKVLVDNVLWDLPQTPGMARLVNWLPAADSRGGLLGWVAVSGFVLWLLQALIDNTVVYLSTRAGRGMAYDVAEKIFSVLQRQSLLYHGRHGVGDSMTRVVTDSWCVSGLVDKLVIAPVPALLTIGAMVLIMRRMDPGLTLIALAAAPLMAGTALIFGRRVRQVARARREVESRIQAHLQQTLTGIHTVQAFGQESREQAQFRGFAEAVISAQKRTVLLKHVSTLWTGLIATLGTGAVLLIGGRHVLGHTLSLGALLVFVSYLHALQAQMNALVRAYTGLQSLRGQLDRVLEILAAKRCQDEFSGAQMQGRSGPIDADPLRGEVRLDNVTFGYEPGRPVLSEVSLAARPGEVVALVGRTGAGKTTLISLIPRLFDPWKGRVSIDGIDVREMDVRRLRQQVAMVLQDSYLFPESIADNIACGRPEASREEVVAAARNANAHEFILHLPQGYDTVVGERGCTLSGGQRQRIAIARAFLKNAPVLILDEPTSSVDAQSEELLVQALRRLMHGRTTFIVAHRLSTIRRADRIIVLDGGRVIESGRHEQLMAIGGMYAGLVRAIPDAGSAPAWSVIEDATH